MWSNRAPLNTKDDIVTSSNISRRHMRTMAGVMLVTAGASVIGLVGAAAPANAATDAYVAVAIGLVNDAPPVTTVGGLSIAADQNSAYQGALTDCVNKGGHQCVVEAVEQNGCAAAASNDFGEMVGGTDITLRTAEDNASGKLENQQGARIVAAGCSNGDLLPPAPPPPPAPAPPKLGPTVSFNLILGGLEAHITDRSGVASQCTYVMDEINRSFGLAANSTFDLRIVPAIPRFKDRTVTITCDNGTKTQATTRF
jgi:adhesin HecA-like repeat protein